MNKSISERKLKHSLEVARECKNLAIQMNKDEAFINAAFVMGFLHDIGYEICEDNISTHPEKGYKMLQDATKHLSEIMQAIKTHGTKYSELSEFEYILNKADLTVDHVGKHVSIEERLESIKERYGGESVHYKDAIAQAEAVKKTTFRRIM